MGYIINVNYKKQLMNIPSILIITHINFWDKQMGSHQRLFSLIKYLEKYFSLDLIYLEPKKDTDIVNINKLNLKTKIIFIDDLDEYFIDIKKQKEFLSRNKILQDFNNDSFVSKVNGLLNKKNYSHIIIEYIHLSYFLPILKDKILILDSHDIMSKRNLIFKMNNQKHWIDIFEKEELEIFKYFDKVLAIQKSEYKYLIDNNINSLYIPHPINVYKNSYSNRSDKYKIVIFIGGFNAGNNNAIQWFIKNIWNYFEKNPYIKLFIYGSVCNALKDNLIDSNIELKGNVENLEEVYNKALIAINPVQIGGGLKIKNIESMSFGVPLITTSIGAKGLEDCIDKGFIVANSKDEWIKTLLNLLLYPKLRESLSNEAYKYINKNFNENKSFIELKNFIKN